MKLIAAVLVLGLAASLRAQESAQFTRIGVGARAIGMGGAYTALADDASSLHWNPAGLAGMRKRELSLMYADLSSDMRYNWVGYGQPMTRNIFSNARQDDGAAAPTPTRYGTLALGVVYLDQGTIGGRDEGGRITGGYGASDSGIALGYGKGLGALRLGGNVKYLRSSVGGDTGQTYALDVGSLYSFGLLGPGVPMVGFAVQNLGPGLRLGGRSSPLPLTLSWGAAYRLPVGMTLALDVRHRPYADSSEVSLGTEYALMSNFFLRAGYASNHGPVTGSAKISDLSGFAAGFGARFSALSLDYSVAPYGGLGNAQRVSLGARF